MSSIGLNCHVFVDFDGTIATVDTTDALLEQFADPAWQGIEDEWKQGRIGSRECMVRQIDLVRATPQALDAFVSGIEIDSGFPDFVALCRANGHPVTVVSDGLDRTVKAVLRNSGLDLPVFANRLEHVGDARWRLSFPYSRDDCRSLAGNCKCQFTHSLAGQIRIMVGDGRSDFCVSGVADLVLAKGALEQHCRTNRLPHFAFTTFDEATSLLAAWLDEHKANSPNTDARRDE